MNARFASALSACAIAAAVMPPVQAQDQEAAYAPASERLRAAIPMLSDVPGLTLTGYEVDGGSSRDIRRSLNAGRPQTPDGVRHDAGTIWRFATQLPRTGPDGQCDPAAATVRLSVTMILPDLTTRDRLSARDQSDWDRYFTALVTHEHNHARIAIEGAARMQAAMRATPGASCEAIRAAGAAVGAAVADASRQYDQGTNHGQSEGVQYPPRGR